MKAGKRILFVVLLIVAVMLTLMHLSYMLRPVQDSEDREARNRVVGFYAEEEDSLDVVFIGSSAIYRYISNPQMWDEQGITSYSFGTPGQSIFMLPYMIDEVRDTQSPEVIVIETRQFFYTEDENYIKTRFQKLVDNLKYSKNRCKIINELVKDPEEKLKYYFDIATYHNNWEYLDKASLEYIDNEKESEMKGWRNIVAFKAIEYTDMTNFDDSVPMSDVAQETLYNLLEKCKKENIELLFVATPWQVSEEFQAQSNYMKEIVEENGYQYIDFNRMIQEMGMDFIVDFYNESHVNAVGASKVTQYIGKYISEHYNIENIHSEESTVKWNHAAQKNKEEMLSIMEQYNSLKK